MGTVGHGRVGVYAPNGHSLDEDGHRVAVDAVWYSPNAVKDTYWNASIIASGRVVFTIAGNKYRLVSAIDYRRGLLFVKFVGTHRPSSAVIAQIR